MSISKINAIECEAEVCGQIRSVAWSSDNGQFTVLGIDTMHEAMELLKQLSLNDVLTMAPDTLTKMQAASQPAGNITVNVSGQIATVPVLDPAPTKAEKKKSLQIEVEGPAPAISTPEPPPVAPIVQPAKAAPTPPAKTAAKPVTAKPAPAVAPPAAEEDDAAAAPAAQDDSVFGRFTKVSEVVQEIRTRIGMERADFTMIVAEATRLRDEDLCPALEVLKDGMVDRLRTHCAAKGVAGTAA